MKKRILFLLVLVLALLIFTSTLVYADEDYIEPLTEKAIILEVGEILTNDQSSGFIQTQNVKLKIISGKYKGEVRDIENHLSDNVVYNIIVEEGDKVVVMIEEYGDDFDVFIADYSRTDYMLYLTIFFILLMLVIGKTKGLKVIISLSLTIGSIFYILLPQLLKGADPIPISIGIAIGVTVITIFLVSGINSKSAAAIIGTSIGVVIAGLISYYVGLKINLTGLSAEEATMLMYIPQEITFDFKNLLFSGIILGALGAIMDVGMSIASAIDEIHNANNSLTSKELFSSGMNVGKDVMGTMTNTLILAYTGYSNPLLLLFTAYETSLVKVLNLDIIATEIIRSLSGSIGLVLTIPITAFIASVLIKREKHKK
ncbi:MAG: YibE/F family protein [Tissierellia bacterium]|nr:YibE/F family protein [Tissierellia bacterium]